MKFKLITLYIALVWLAIFVAGLWVFKVLIEASPVPEFATGLFGGAIYALVMREIWRVFWGTLQDVETEWRNGLSRSELRAIKAGISDVAEGRTVPLEEIRERLKQETVERERQRTGKLE